MAERVQIKSSTRRTKYGKVINVRSYNQNRDTVGESLKSEGRAPIAAQPGSFPNGRSTPTSPAVAKYESQRQDSELLAAQIRARVAKEKLARLTEQLKDETGTVTDETDFTSVINQLDQLMSDAEAAEASGEGYFGGVAGGAA